MTRTLLALVSVGCADALGSELVRGTPEGY
jgi:hypothetical protein